MIALLLLAANPTSIAITIAQPDLRVPPGGVGAGALYLVISNQGAADRLVGAKCKLAAHTMLHETVIKGDVAKMVHAESWDVPAKGKLELKRGGKHIMLMSMKVKPGDSVQVVLQFVKAGEIAIDVTAKSLAE